MISGVKVRILAAEVTVTCHDGASYQAAVDAARDLVTTARNITHPTATWPAASAARSCPASTRPADHERVTCRQKSVTSPRGP